MTANAFSSDRDSIARLKTEIWGKEKEQARQVNTTSFAANDIDLIS